MSLAPIVLFAYKRPLHTKATLEKLSQNTLAAHSRLYIYIDGLKESATEADQLLHREVVALAGTQTWALETHVVESKLNKGLAVSVVDGVSGILKKHGKVIVLEDDLITSPRFLEFMNNALDAYEKQPEVACISGYVYPFAATFQSAYFVKGADCWGWATWQDKWESIFRNEPVELYDELNQKQLTGEFNFNHSYPYMEMLKDRIDGKNQSWAVLWYASAFLANTYCLYPPQSLVHNIGNDGSGTHNNDTTHHFDVKSLDVELPLLPADVTESKKAREAFEQFFRKLRPVSEISMFQRIKDKFKAGLRWN